MSNGEGVKSGLSVSESTKGWSLDYPFQNQRRGEVWTIRFRINEGVKSGLSVSESTNGWSLDYQFHNQHIVQHFMNILIYLYDS